MRFVQGLEQGGIPLEAVGSAVQSGELSFDFFDASFWDRFGGLAAKTYRELSAETGLSLDLLQAIRESMGFARPGPDDRLREDEFDTVALVRALIAAGVDPVAMERHVRTWGESIRRIAEADANLYRTQIMERLRLPPRAACRIADSRGADFGGRRRLPRHRRAASPSTGPLGRGSSG